MLDAVQRAHRLVRAGQREVVDRDLSNYFGEIPHVGLLQSVARHLSDGRLLGWIKRWLEMAVVGDDGKGASAGRTGRGGSARGRRKGPRLPVAEQGLNAAVHRGVEDAGHARRFAAEFVNHAGDFVICRRAPAAATWAVVERITEQLRLPLDATKTRSMRVPEEPLECQGYPIWRNYKPSTGPLTSARVRAKGASAVCAARLMS